VHGSDEDLCAEFDTPTMLARGDNSPAAVASGPLSGVDLDESPGALPVADQLSIALSTNAACIIDLFAELDQDQNGTIAFGEFDEGLRMLGLAVPTLYIKLLFKAWDREYARPAVHILPLALVCMLHSRLLALSPPSLSPLSLPPLSLSPPRTRMPRRRGRLRRRRHPVPV
jgi:hypothetical protein